MRTKIFVCLLIAGLLLSSPPLLAQAAKEPKDLPPQAEKAVAPARQAEAVAPEPDHLQVLQKMCDFLKSQRQFTYKAEVADDQVYAGGKKLQYGIDMESFVRLPDHLRVNAEGDLVDKQF